MPELAPPAEIVQTDSAPSQPISLANLTPEEKQNWRMTGELPKPKADDSAPSKETADNADSATAKTDASGSEPEQKQQDAHRQKTKADTERRIQDLLSEVKNLRTELAEARKPKEPESVKQQSQPAPETKKTEASPEPKIDDKDDKGEFKYKTLEEYNAALRKWDREQILKEVEERSAKASRETTQKQQQEVITKNWNEKVDAARKKYADFDAVALKTDLPVEIKQGGVVDLFTLDSPHGADVLYALTKDDCAELARISKLNPIAQARELTKLELQFSEQPKEPAKPKTSASKPPSEVGNRGTNNSDALASAAQANDFRSFKTEANRRALARQ